MTKEQKDKPVSEQEEVAIIAYAKHKWGRGRDLKTAMENCRVNSKDEIAIIIIAIPEGTPYDEENKDGVMNEVWVDEMGSIHYPQGAIYKNITKNPVRVTHPKK